ncbi:MAG: conditioned medium-induced protein 4 [Halobellus sp.]|uniref:conditioned medium-induced protein 4 n=1 Tax=Halobellus sp. TaxID=1979212 RepID=UPI0035D4824E
MDDKTAELRDLFVDATGEETVTESQSDPRGSLSESDDATVEERLIELVEEMRERYEFASSLSTSDLVTVVRAFFDPDATGADAESWSGAADAALASSLSADVDGDAVFRARMDLHLVSDADRDAPIPYDRLRSLVSASTGDDGSLTDDELTEAIASGVDSEAVAETDVTPETVRGYRRVVEADLVSRRANHRFRDVFTDLLTDADLSTRLAEDARRDGLQEATEDIETDVSL